MHKPLTFYLTESQGYLPYYRNALANHAPMALTALDRMGADESRLARFFNRYKARLAPFESKPPKLWPNWRVALGDRSAFPDLLAHFSAAIGQDGMDEILFEALPTLLPGVGASAFHGVIRTAYGVRAANVKEVAHGLAFWAGEYVWLGSVQPASRLSMLELLERHGKAFWTHEYGPGIIADRMREIARRPDFADMPQQPASLGWSALLALAGQAYSATGNFTLLHGLTGAHALFELSPWLTEPEPALRSYWLAFLLAFVTSRQTLPLQPLANGTTTPESAREWALDQLDDHDIKLVWTCLDLLERLPDYRSIWLAVIERRMAGRGAVAV